MGGHESGVVIIGAENVHSRPPARSRGMVSWVPAADRDRDDLRLGPGVTAQNN